MPAPPALGSSMPRRNCAAILRSPCCNGRPSTRASICWALIAKKCLQVAREVGADTFAHGATGKGNDQCRFQLAAEALEPGITVVVPWRRKAFRDKFPGRTEMIAYCEQRKIPVKASIS
ncbi:MAG: argininosuccinate synthase, partial [Pirellulaceae bacterium]|nr:argininosuccinate synthase [Pirellulaceae bacterium]